PRNTVYLELAAGRVVIELAPRFAPHYVANVEALAREGYFDGLSIIRAQDNYVVQWGDPDGKRPIRTAQRTLAAEFERAARSLPFTPLPDPDTYAPEVGFSDEFPVAVDPKLGRAWLVHCYGMVGAGRDNDVDSGGGTELEVLRADTPSFAAYVEARRNRHEEWFKVPAGRLDICNMPVPVRARVAAGAAK